MSAMTFHHPNMHQDANKQRGNPQKFIHRLILLSTYEYFMKIYAHCFDGHLVSAYEQKTQQSPGLGLSVSPHFRHL